jgi:hypothetical protein
MGVPLHGKNGLIYISGTEITGANAWSLNITQDSIETPQFGDTWKKRVVGHSDWSGSVTAWMHTDSKIITNAATAGVSVALLIYPVRTDLTDYFSGSAIFGASMAGGSGAAIGRDGDFVGNDTLTITGFS